MTQRGKLAIFAFAALLIFGLFYVVSSGVGTLQQLKLVEAERDGWQRPLEVLAALGLKEGNVVVDLGSGAGYFTLKMSPAVGRSGQVLAVDLRKLSLAFLWIRAAMRSPHNIRVNVGEPDDPHLASSSADAVLIANTYHEFREPKLMLEHVFRSLRRGGRLVIVDRGPRVPDTESREGIAPGHEVSMQAVEDELSQEGFEIVRRENPFIDRPGDEPWWLLAARKP